MKRHILGVVRCLLLVAVLGFAQSGAALTDVVSETDECQTSLAIDGAGYFVIQAPNTGEAYVTRYGDFRWDAKGYLVTGEGAMVQGFQDSGLSVIGNIKLDADRPSSADPCAQVDFFRIGQDGKVFVRLTDATTYVSGQVLLQAFQHPEKLVRIEAHVYAASSAAGLLPGPVAPGSNGLGLIVVTNNLESEPLRLSVQPRVAEAGPIAQGALYPTGVPTDLGIQGKGFFVVRDTNTCELFATRAGFFLRDKDGYLVTYSGLRVQGYSDPSLSTSGDVRIDAKMYPFTYDQNPVMNEYIIRNDGVVVVQSSGGIVFPRSQILLQEFQSPQLLVKTNNGLYAGIVAAKPLPMGEPGKNGFGIIRQGGLELIHASEDLLSARQEFQFFTQGPIARTDYGTDLALAGTGFFVVKDPKNEDLYVTRAGDFRLDDAGYLATFGGLRVQGFSNCARSIRGDVQINAAERPAGFSTNASLESFYINSMGTIQVRLNDGSVYVRGQILLQDFQFPYVLAPAGHNLYTNLVAAGPLAQPAMPSTQALGYIQSGALELSATPAELVLPSPTGKRLLITGEPNTRGIVQVTTNLMTWGDLGVVDLGSFGETDFTNAEAASSPVRFYRVTVVSP